MPIRKIAAIALVLTLWGAVSGQAENRTAKTEQISASPETCRRIISMSPSITEILFALELGNNVAAVTRFCDYPPAVKNKPTIGGFLDPNYEKIVALSPDLVVLPVEHDSIRERLRKLKIETLAVNHKNPDGILESIRQVGERCRCKNAATELRDEISRRLEAVQSKLIAVKRPEVLLVVDRERGNRNFPEVYVAGNDGFYSRLLKLAHAKNAYTGDMAFPVLSREGLIRLDPDIIIDIAVPLNKTPDIDAAAEDWNTLPMLKAVKTKRVHLLTDPVVVRPGPRYPDALELLAGIIHPGAAAGKGTAK